MAAVQDLHATTRALESASQVAICPPEPWWGGACGGRRLPREFAFDPCLGRARPRTAKSRAPRHTSSSPPVTCDGNHGRALVRASAFSQPSQIRNPNWTARGGGLAMHSGVVLPWRRGPWMFGRRRRRERRSVSPTWMAWLRTDQNY